MSSISIYERSSPSSWENAWKKEGKCLREERWRQRHLRGRCQRKFFVRNHFWFFFCFFNVATWFDPTSISDGVIIMLKSSLLLLYYKWFSHNLKESINNCSSKICTIQTLHWVILQLSRALRGGTRTKLLLSLRCNSWPADRSPSSPHAEESKQDYPAIFSLSFLSVRDPFTITTQ